MSISKGKMKIGSRFILSGFLVLMTLLATMTLTTVTSFAATDSVVNGGTSQDLQKAIDEANSGSSIFISGIVTIDETVNINKNVTLTGNGTLIREDGFKDAMVYVDSNSELIMEDITIDGNGVSGVESAVYIDNGKLQMKSGTIQRNGSRGVYNYYGSFKMTGGNISESEASYGGGVYNYRGSNFKMTNGTISSNKASRNGGGIYNNSGKVKITDGSAVITGNSPKDKYGC